MNLAEIHTLLITLADYDGRPLTDTMVSAWHPLLKNTKAADAMEAVRVHYGNADAKRMLVGDVRTLARGIADRRQAAEDRRALAAAPVQLSETGKRMRAEALAMARRFGDLNRRPAVARPDPSVPTLPDSEITEDVKARWLARLDAMAAA